jgi:hypothetical protein
MGRARAAAVRVCTLNKRARIPTVAGTIPGSRPGATTRRPSTALNTLIAGVMMPSPNRSDAPTMTRTVARQGCPNCSARL